MALGTASVQGACGPLCQVRPRLQVTLMGYQTPDHRNGVGSTCTGNLLLLPLCRALPASSLPVLLPASESSLGPHRSLVICFVLHLIAKKLYYRGPCPLTIKNKGLRVGKVSQAQSPASPQRSWVPRNSNSWNVGTAGLPGSNPARVP